MERVHGTALAFGSHGVLIRGPSGRGKSDLALRCLALPLGQLVPFEFRLVADDQVVLERRDTDVWMSCPVALVDLLEVRGVGIVKVQSIRETQLKIVIDLVERDRVPRMPDVARVAVFGADVPALSLYPFEASAPLKVALALLETLKS